MAGITISFEGTDDLFIGKLEAKAGEIYEAMRVKLDELDLRLQAKIVGEKLHGQVLNQVSGKLAGSIRVIPAAQNGPVVTGGVEGGGGPAFYGAVHEYGGTSSYTITPVNAQALAFMMNGKLVFAKSVNHPPAKERSFMRSSLAEMTQTYVDELQLALEEAVKG